MGGEFFDQNLPFADDRVFEELLDPLEDELLGGRILLHGIYELIAKDLWVVGNGYFVESVLDGLEKGLVLHVIEAAHGEDAVVVLRLVIVLDLVISDDGGSL